MKITFFGSKIWSQVNPRAELGQCIKILILDPFWDRLHGFHGVTYPSIRVNSRGRIGTLGYPRIMGNPTQDRRGNGGYGTPGSPISRPQRESVS